MEILTKSAFKTQKLGKKLANTLKNGGVVACYGELGSGKTTFVQGLVQGLGIKQRVLSPTFVFIRQYKLLKGEMFYHVDLYRINKKEEAYGLGLEEFLSNPQNIVVIEWAEKIKEILPKKRIDIYFEYISETERRIKLNIIQ